jgi:hypothetical protein
MLSIARKSVLNSNITRVAQRSIVVTKPLIVSPEQQLQQGRRYTNASATAEKVIIHFLRLSYIILF